ncbi:phosphotransferase [Pelagibius sp. Alg239-R121]|uniref:phosphotransferase n=1 Tax=Pelagibius sp. Alg239-R121 TaxID=2993448 RepID=UPI002AC32E84|nr:phosphotransferase [Pelagibius sp. Alg239-R121]
MRAQVLIVEDDEDFVQELMASITRVSANVDITVARCRERACQFLDERFFDFAILDLSIPTQDGGLDGDPDHGKFVFHHARVAAPGTKILVLTGSPSGDFIADMLAQKHDADIWSEGRKIGTVEFLRKIDLIQVDDIVSKALNAIHSLGEIELGFIGVNLQTSEDRLIRIFAKKFGAARCDVSLVSPGQSGAAPFRLQLFDGSGTPIQVAVAKLAPLNKVMDENARYDQHVVLLDPASTPRKMITLEFGAGATAGIFYQLADGYTQSLFAALGNDDAQSAKAVDGAAAALSKWAQGNAEVRQSIAEIRQCWIDDVKAEELKLKFELDWAPGFEAREVQTRQRCVHGDLHGENLLVSVDGRLMVIDFGDVRQGVASYDPMTLELSAVLQANPTFSDAWPTLEQCRNWNDLDAYLVESPIPLFISACRTWGETCAAGRREVAASAYSYLLRQLKYEDTKKERILALMEGVKAYIAAT